MLSLWFLLIFGFFSLLGVSFWVYRIRTQKTLYSLSNPKRNIVSKQKSSVTSEKTEYPIESTACPSCLREFSNEFRYCLHDASPLISQNQVDDSVGGMFCPQCHRGFEYGVFSCPYDKEELLPYSVFRLTHCISLETEKVDFSKICPICTHHYQGTAIFCGRDASELVSMN